MRHIDNSRSRPAVAVLVLLLAGLALAACGGSSNGSASSNAGAVASTSTGATAGSPRGRFAAFRACLQKNGIALPKRPPGQGRAFRRGGFPGFGAGPPLPKGVTRAQYEEAVKKCGGGAFAGGRARFNGPAAKQALTEFAACMRSNGVNLPTPNTSGKGPIFDTGSQNTRSAKFQAARARCEQILAAGRPPGAPGSGPAGAGPGSG